MIKRHLLSLDFWVLIFSLLLLRLPVAIGYRQSALVRTLFLTPIFIVIIKNLIQLILHPQIHFKRTLLAWFVLYAVVESLSFFRTATTNFFPTITVLGNWLVWFSMGIFGFLIFSNVRNKAALAQFRAAIYYALILYVFLNAALHITGYQSPENIYFFARSPASFQAILLKNVGITMQRVVFPTASGINSFGIVAGAAFVSSFVLFLSSKKLIDRIMGGVGFLSSLYIILLTDSRGPLFFAFITIFIFAILPISLITIWRWLPIMTPVLPYMLTFSLRYIPISILQKVSRSFSGGTTSDSLSGRLLIWQAVLDSFRNFQFIHLFGFGYRGQVVSGVSQKYASLFSIYADPEISGAHNFVMQTLLEVGYLGVIISIGFITAILFHFVSYLKAHQDHTVKVLFFILIYLLLAGTTESVLTVDHQELFTIFMFIWAAVGSLPNKAEKLIQKV